MLLMMSNTWTQAQRTHVLLKMMALFGFQDSVFFPPSSPIGSAPVQIQGVTTAVRAAINGGALCVLLEDSTLVSYGSGSLGLGPNVLFAQSPTLITGIPKIVDIKASSNCMIALTVHGEVLTWGNIAIAGPAGYLDFPSPTPVSGLNDIVAISAKDDGYHFLAIDSSKNCYAWGKNGYGEFGFPHDPANHHFLYPVTIATDVVDILAGEYFTYIVKSDGSLWGAGWSFPLDDRGLWLNYEQAATQEKLESFEILLSAEETSSCEFAEVPHLELPNVFTPNRDNINDLFQIISHTNITEMKFYIMNRWGEIVYEHDGLNPKWSGHSQTGVECSEGVYFYRAEFRSFGAKKHQQAGQITLIR
jgi:gliding motility-associated-like protein